MQINFSVADSWGILAPPLMFHCSANALQIVSPLAYSHYIILHLSVLTCTCRLITLMI